MKIVILVGPPGSGKSTYASSLEAQGYIRISQDDQGKAGHLELFKAALERGDNIVVDRMSFNVEQRSRYLIPAKAKGYSSTIEIFHVPRQVCMDRCMAREGHPTINGNFGDPKMGGDVGYSVDEKRRQASSAIGTFFKKYERPSDLEADEIIRHGWDSPTKAEVVVCDLDGTLCNIDHRLHYMKQAKKDWKSFNAEISKDSINEWCADLIEGFISRDEENYFGNGFEHILYSKLVFCSGRDDSNRKVTQDWLDKHSFGEIPLYMRPRDDFRKDYIIKEIILEFELKTRYNILFAIDDRQQVVDMWRKHGITCLQCAKGDF